MTTEYIFPLADPRASLETVGGKGASLARLAQAGLPVPGGFHVTTAAYRQFVAENNLQPAILVALASANAAQPATLEAASGAIQAQFLHALMPPAIAEAITRAYSGLGEDGAVAVRSSATAEDLPELSFAGQQDTYLNIRGADAVLEAVKKCWASLWTARAIGYRLQHHIDQNAVSLAVVVQSLVCAQSAGVLFTANPLTGQRAEAMLTAAWGLGEAVVGGRVTPDTFTLDKATGRVLKRDVADKQVMTVRVNGGTQELPVPEAQRRLPALTDPQAAELAQQGVKIEELYQQPMDIEWALAEGRLAILQARPITALPEPEIPLPADAEWPLPDPKPAYFRGSITEQLPDPLTPLFATLGARIIGLGSARLFNTLCGPGTAREDMLLTINGYAYYQMRLSLRFAWGMLTGIVAFWPELVRSEQRWRDAHAHYAGVIDQWRSRPASALTSGELLEGARQLMTETVNVYNVLQSGALGLASGAEVLFAAVYDRLAKRRGDPPAATFLLGFDSLPILADKSLYDLAQQARACPALAEHLVHTPAAQLVNELSSEQPPADLPADDWSAWQRAFSGHLERYGHAVYDLDFAKPLPADDPAPLLDTCKLYLSGRGTNPHERQQALANRREQITEALYGRLGGLRLKLVRKTLGWARTFAPLREDGLADLGLGYPLLRRLLRELGRRLNQAGMISEPDEVYWLSEDEAAQAAGALDRGEALNRFAEEIRQRKAVWRAQKRLTPPTALPVRSRMSRAVEGVSASRTSQAAGNVIKGAGASQGCVTGKARVLHGPEDFGQMQPGEVLVAAVTTPAWTPLFAMAAAIVTDVGGPLSHGSIVAREYGIPAVLGTGVATKRIRSGQVVTVDGTAGTVTLLAKPGAPPSIEWRTPNPKGQYIRGSAADLMADPMCPLFVSLALPAINQQGVKRVLKMFTRSEVILPGDYISSVNGYLYAGMSYTLREWWWILTRMMPSAVRIMRMGIPFWRDDVRPRYAALAKRWEARSLPELPSSELLAGVRELVEMLGEYVATLLVSTMGASAGSEGMMTRVYEKLVKRAGDPAAPTFLMGYDSLPIRAEKSLFDLAEWARTVPDLAGYLLSTPAADLTRQIAVGEPPAGLMAKDWAEFQARFRAHLDQYGHAVYNLDFGSDLPLDKPQPLLAMVKLYLRGEGINPHDRQRAAEQNREQGVQAILGRLKGWRRWAFQKSLRWAQSLSAVREEALADIGLGYPALRQMLRELGRRLAAAGALEQAEDIFWLNADELVENVGRLEARNPLPDLTSSVQERKAFQARMKAVTPPPMLPLGTKKWLGLVDMSAFVPADAASQAQGLLKGVGASAGTVTAPASVLHGPEDFDLMQPGSVLVAGVTTPAWTPLFAMAAGIVTDIGGPLSHGSIVAREYGIPAVLGTGVATQRIQSGQVITVDGTAGTVTLSDDGADTRLRSGHDDAPPTEWKLPKGQYAAVRNNIVELMPEPLTPLFGTWGRAIINACLGRLLALFVRQPNLMSSDLIITVNGYAYNNGSVRLGKLLPLLLDSVGILRRMFNGAVERWTQTGRPRYVSIVEDWQTTPWRGLSASALLAGAHDIFEAAIEAYGALISGVIPGAWITEGLFTVIYNALLKRRSDPAAATYLLGFDSAPIRAEKALYDLAEWARSRAALAGYLASNPAQLLAAQLPMEQAPHDIAADDWREWQQRFQAYLGQHGHAFYNLDFANAVPADDPAPLLETCKLFLRGQGTNPYTRQQAAAQQREQAAKALEQRLRGWRLNLFHKFYPLARRYAPLREDGLAEVGLGYPLLRQMLRELGRRLVESGMLEHADDIFWLEQAEVEQAVTRLDGHQALESAMALVLQRQARWQAARKVPPPLMLPQMKVAGVDLMEIRTGRSRKMAAKVIRGVAASSGRTTAPARVLRGPEDFGQMQAGEVLVAAITTPAWTPLFAMAAGIVTDVGGPLSHGSIVAREYGIPAVLGTGVATQRIRSGQVITVDGAAGTVTFSQEN